MKRFSINNSLPILAIALLAAGYHLYRITLKPTPTQLGTVIRKDLVQQVTVSGLIIPNRKTVISTPYSGYVRKIFVKIGDKVKAGDPIVSISQSAHGSADDIYPLRAPFPGTVVQVYRTDGEYVELKNSQLDSALVRIDDLSQMLVSANVTEMEVLKLAVGQEVSIAASAVLGQEYLGRIKSISMAAKETRDFERSKGDYPISILVTNADSQLKPGMTVIAEIVTKKIEKALTLDQKHIRREGRMYFVETEGGEKKRIETGIQNEESIEIKKGVAEGERVKSIDLLSSLEEL